MVISPSDDVFVYDKLSVEGISGISIMKQQKSKKTAENKAEMAKSVEEFYRLHNIKPSEGRYTSANLTGWNKTYFAVQLSDKTASKFSRL